MTLNLKIRLSSLRFPAILVSAVLLIFLINKVSSVVLLAPLFLLFSVYFHLRRAHFEQLVLALLVSCSGSIALLYLHSGVLVLYYLIDLIYNKNNQYRSLQGFDHRLLLFFIIGLLGYLITQVVEFNVASFPLFLVSTVPPLSGYLYFCRHKLNESERKKIIIGLFIICVTQAIIAFFDYVIWHGILNILFRRVTPDLVSGTFRNTPELTYFFLLTLIVCFNFIRVKKGFYIKLLAVFVLCITILASARFYFLVFVLAYGFTISCLDFFIVHKAKFFNRAVSIAFISLLLVVVIQNFSKIYEGFLDLYIVGKYNNKVIYYQRALNPDNRNIIQYLIGTGPGTIGSRSSNLRAYNTLHKKEGQNRTNAQSFIPPFSSIWTKKYLADLYDEDYAEASGNRSALLGNPFNSTVAIIFEFGLLGFLIYSSIFIGIVIKCLRIINYETLNPNDRSIILGLIILSITNYTIGFLDQSIDRPFVMFIFWIFFGLVSNIVSDINQKVLKN